MTAINLIKKLEKVSFNISNKILRIKGYIQKKNKNEYLEILIYRGFSSSTTHPIEIDQDKDVIDQKCVLIKGEILEAPMLDNSNKVLTENKNIEVFLDINCWS